MSAQPSSPKPKILVVDDEPDHLDALQRTFYSQYRVLRAESAAIALEILAREKNIAVVITDQRMPKMTGTELLKIAATRYPDTIRIIITAYADVQDLVEAINTGQVFKYVTKPWELEDLQATVRQAVETHQVLRSRTRDLRRTLRQEALLNAVTNTIRSARGLQQTLQTIVDTVGQMFETSYCFLRPLSGDLAIARDLIYISPNAPTRTEERVLAGNGREAGKRDVAEAPKILEDTIWETQEIVAIDDARNDDRVRGNPARDRAYAAADIRSSLIVPLVLSSPIPSPDRSTNAPERSPLALLALHQCGETRTWRDDEIQLLYVVAEQASLTLSQARAYEQVRELAQREALVNSITAAIRSSLDPQEIFAAITEQLGRALDVDGCALSLWTQEDEYVQCVGLYDREEAADPKQEAGSVPLPQSIVPIAGNPVLLQLLETQAPVGINDLMRDRDENLSDLLLRKPARALLLVPLLLEGKIIGSISLRQHRAPRQWRAFEIELSQAVAAQAAIAVQQSRLYQQTKQQAERLLELDRQKTELFQNISHEFRTPLTLMMGPLESATNAREGLDVEQTAISLRNCRRLLRLVNQLLDLQRLDAGRMQPLFRPCDPIAFVRQTLEAFQPYCDRKGVQIATELQPVPLLYLDLDKFDKVFYNLLSNAMKFTPPGGTIEVRTEVRDGFCLLHVKDTGIGIHPDQLPHLFERFRQAEGSANRSFEGSGLGLALAKELAKLHGGQITIDSVLGSGSTFTIWVPLGASHLPPDCVLETPSQIEDSRARVEFADLETDLHREEEEPPAESDRDAIVLVVDDNADLRTYVSGILKKAGYRVLRARNGAEALQVARDRRPDLIVTDLMMPLVSGLDLIASVREDPNLTGTPIILLTAKVNEDTRVEGVEKGADAYLSKPFNDRELLAETRNLLALKANERKVAQLNTYLTESVLRRFLPPAMVERAARGDLSLNLAPEPKLVTILFSDIVGFTPLANALRSRRIARVLNEYLAEMGRAIFANGGTVDKFVGDAVLALFGAPEEIAPREQVRRAIATAREMHRALDRLNERWRDRDLPAVRFRCGIHQGTAVVGMFGSEERSDYTAVGPCVNLAARLQEAAGPDRILISDTVADYLEDNEIEPHQKLDLKGIDEPVPTFFVRLDEKP